MKILKIRLQNWQSHVDTTLDFSSSLNIITGESDSGKTSIKRAITWVCFGSNVSERDYRRYDSKETIVTLWLDNGFQVERVRSDTLNRYILRKEGCEEKVFDAIGKDIPEEVKIVLSVHTLSLEDQEINLNVAEQMALPFLQEVPSSFRAKLFNKLTGNELLDQIFKFLNKENLRISKDIKTKDALLIEQENQISVIQKEYEHLNTKLNTASEKLNIIKNKNAYLEELKGIFKKFISLNQRKAEIGSKLNKIVLISDVSIQSLIEKEKKLSSLKNIKNTLTEIKKKLYTIDTRLKTIKSVDISFENLIKKAEHLEKLKKMSEKHTKISDKKKQIEDKLSKLHVIINEEDIKINDLKRQIKTCPSCGQIICKENNV